MDGRAAVIESTEHQLQRAALLRHGNEPEQHLGDDAQRPFGTGEEARQVVARDVLDGLAAGLQDRAVGEDHFEAHDVVGRHAVLDGPHAAGILRHVAADGGEFPACRVGRVEEPLGGAVVVEIDRANPGLGPDHHVVLVEFDDLRHALQGEGDAALEGNASAGAAARGTPRRDGDPLLVGDGHELRHFLRRQRAARRGRACSPAAAARRMRHRNSRSGRGRNQGHFPPPRYRGFFS